MADDVESEQAFQEEDEVLEDGNYTEDENKDLGFHAGNRTLSGIEESKEQETSSEARHETPESTPPMSRIGVNDHKAGMEGLDKARINEIILEASKGSKFYNNEVKKEKQVSLRIKQMMERMKTLTEAQQVSALKTVDKEIESLECSRHLNRIIVHVDMDAFYAAVEMRDSPKLRNVPMAVGGNSMLSTSNYVARKYGVRAAMPGFIGRKLCPDLVIVPVNFAKYTAVSEQVREVLCRYDPHFSPMGLDESYLDITACVTERHRQMTWGNLDNSLAKEREQTVDDSTDSCILDEDPTGQSDWWEESGVPSHLWSVAQEVVREMRGKIEQQTQLTASAGIAPNKMLAKIASDMNKPNGQYFLTPTRDAVLHFIHSLPIRKIPGIGKVTERMLNALNITTCRDLYDQRALLHLLFSQVSSHYFLRVCLGLGSVEVDKDYQRKSMSTERTFSEISKPEELMLKCKKLCDRLSESLVEEGLRGRTVTLKIKTSDFRVSTRAMSGKKPMSSSEDLFAMAQELLQVEISQASPNPLCLRLMGVRLSNLEENASGNIRDFFKKVDPQKSTTGTDSIEEGYLSDNVIITSDNDSNLSPAKKDAPRFDGQDTDESHEHGLVLQSEPSTSAQENTISCPLCGVPIYDDNAVLNQHIDICLNRDVVTEVVQAVDRPPTCNIEKGGVSPSATANSRKRKDTESSKSAQRKKSKKTKCNPPSVKLEHFFKN